MIEAGGNYRFGPFRLDPVGRRLWREEAAVPLSSRYLDALLLMVRHPGELLTKQRFLDQVWNGVPVTDEALSQCIKTLRKQLGDDAACPVFIETVPKHGYRFIAAVDAGTEAASPLRQLQGRGAAIDFMILAAAATAGGAMSGVFVGLLYGLGGTVEPAHAGMGAASVLLVLLVLNILAGAIGGIGVGLGLAAAMSFPRSASPWAMAAGGGASGFLAGAAAKLLGLDAFNLLFGIAPGGMTGGFEGLIVGAALGTATWFGLMRESLRSGVAAGAAAGAAAGGIIPLLGGRLMGGSLDMLSRSFAGSRIDLDPLGRLVGEDGFGPMSQILFGTAEGLIFGGLFIAALLIARRQLLPVRSDAEAGAAAAA